MVASYRTVAPRRRESGGGKDVWDKLAALTTPFATLTLGLLGAYVTWTYNKADLRHKAATAEAERNQREQESMNSRTLSQAEALEKLFVYVSSPDPQKREFGYAMYAAIGQKELAARLILLKQDRAGLSVLRGLSSDRSATVRQAAQAGLSALAAAEPPPDYAPARGFGVRGSDDRIALAALPAPRRSQFQAVGLLKRDGRAVCTGALVRPDIVLTASHCAELFSDSRSASFEIGFGGVDVAVEQKPALIIKDPAIPVYGVALLRLSRTLAVVPLPLRTEPVQPGESFRMAFWAADRGGPVASGGADCTIARVETRYIRHRCDSGGGSSGAPLIDSAGQIVGVNLAAGPEISSAWRVDGQYRPQTAPAVAQATQAAPEPVPEKLTTESTASPITE